MRMWQILNLAHIIIDKPPFDSRAAKVVVFLWSENQGGFTDIFE
jgi:hypothetical protein